MEAPNGGARGWRDVLSEVLDYTPFSDVRRMAAEGPRRVWLTPPRPGISRLVAPWEYRHLRFYGVARIFGGSVAAAAGIVCLSYGVYGWAAFFLAIAALNVAGGSWFLSLDRAAPARA